MKDFLEKRDSACLGGPAKVENVEPFEVSEKPKAEWYEPGNAFGRDLVQIFETVKGYMLRLTWCPAEGYSGGGREEILLSNEEGGEIFRRRHVSVKEEFLVGENRNSMEYAVPEEDWLDISVGSFDTWDVSKPVSGGPAGCIARVTTRMTSKEVFRLTSMKTIDELLERMGK